MKDYDHVVIWLNYFNKSLTRAKGRRLPKEQCIFEPLINELVDAANKAGLVIVETKDSVKFPRKPYVKSGYVVISKTAPKSNALKAIARGLVAKRVKKTKNN